MYKKWIGLVLAVVMVACMAGCGNSTPTANSPSGSPVSTGDAGEPGAANSKGEGYVIGFCNYAVSNSWQVQMEAEFKYKAEALKQEGVLKDYYVTDAGGDVSKQIADFKDLMTKEVDAIIITAASPSALSPVCEEATKKGIVVVAFDSCVETDNIAGKVVSDDMEFGRIGAQFIVDELGGKGDIVVLNGIAGSACSDGRYAGAKEVFDKYPDIKIISETNADWDYAKGKVAIEAVINSGQKVDGIWSQGGAMTQAAVDAYNEAGLKLVPMSGEGSNGFLKTWKENADKGFTSVCPWYPTYISTTAMDQALKVLNGEKIEPLLKMPTESITADQIDQYYNPELPDSYWVITNLTPDQVKKIFQ